MSKKKLTGYEPQDTTEAELELARKYKELTEFEKKFGPVCKVCGKRKGSFISIGSNMGSTSSVCKCKTK